MAKIDRAPFVCLPVAGQSFWTAGEPDERRTALREAAYIRRTKFRKGKLVHDFACRAEDLFMLTPIVPQEAREWVKRPFLRWKLADEATKGCQGGAAVSAWHVVADLPLGMSRGQWTDEAEQLVRDVLPCTAVAEICGHLPTKDPPHIHMLVATRQPGPWSYTAMIEGLERLLQYELKARWLDWLDRCASAPAANVRRAA